MVGPTTTAVFLCMAFGLFALDCWTHRGREAVSLKSAAMWSLFYVAAALLFAVWLNFTWSREASLLFLSGYALEKVLAFDNLFVFAMIFAYFKISPKDRHRALHWGIIGAVAFRLIFVFIGTSLLDGFGFWGELLFAAVIIYTIYIIMQGGEEDPNYDSIWYVKLIRKFYPGASILFITIVVLEVSDVLFAFDSVPAIIAITRDPFLVYSAMIFAILGLRSMYFLIDAAKVMFEYIDEGVIVVLGFIALKLILSAFEVYIPAAWSISIILTILAGAIGVSVYDAKTRGKHA